MKACRIAVLIYMTEKMMGVLRTAFVEAIINMIKDAFIPIEFPIPLSRALKKAKFLKLPTYLSLALLISF